MQVYEICGIYSDKCSIVDLTITSDLRRTVSKK